MKIRGFFLLLFLLPFHFAQGVVIRLNENVSVCGAMVELGDIAEIQTHTLQEKERLAKLKLFPLPQNETIFGAELLKDLLLKKVGKEFIFIGSEVCINPFYTRILQAEIVEKIKTAVRKNYNTVPFDNLSVVFLDPLESIKVPYGDIEIDVAIPVGKFSLTKMARVLIKLDGDIYYNKLFKVKLLAYMNVLVAKRNLQKNEKLSNNNTLFVKKVISENPEQYLTQKEWNSTKGIKINYPVRKGEAILLNRLLSYQNISQK